MCSTESVFTGPAAPGNGGGFAPGFQAGLGGDSGGDQSRSQLERPSGCFIGCPGLSLEEPGKGVCLAEAQGIPFDKGGTYGRRRQDLSQLRRKELQVYAKATL